MKIHFIGIGGIGISALAQYFLALKNKITGSDFVSSEITSLLKRKGAKIFIGKHKAQNVSPDVDMVVYSPAIRSDNPELKKAFKLKRSNSKLQILSYPEALGQLTKEYFTIAVSGTHGKSTTTALISLILIKAGLDPTVIVGTKLKEFNDTNFRISKSLNKRILVIEADEHFASFLNYWPKIIVLTNIEKEHLDFYKNLDRILKTYKKFIGHLPKGGYLIFNKDDKNIKKILKDKKAFSNIHLLGYSLKQKEAKKLRKILKIPGEHNVLNALASLTLSRIFKIPNKTAFNVFSKYKGAWRRFEIKKIDLKNFKNKKIRITIISDYAHHPTEIEATLKSARFKYPRKRILCLFQPHQYQRTYYLFNDFVNVFVRSLKENWIDHLMITDIYEVLGREEKEIKEKVNSQKLVNAINDNLKIRNKAIYLEKNKIINHLKETLKNNSLLILMGAGDIYKILNPNY
jgi:UDP-N-acetylmuramate--alanine ligase